MPAKKGAQDVPTDEHQEAVAKQVEEHRTTEPETGPDPIMEAIAKQDAEADHRTIPDQAELAKQAEAEDKK